MPLEIVNKLYQGIRYPIIKIYFININMKMTFNKLLKFDILKYHTSLSLNL